jgi:hypothetical protein
MFKRLGVGLLKGLVIGGVIGAGLHFGLHLPVVGPLLGYLAAMAAGSTAAVLAGKAPWREGAWIEALLKGLAGLGVGALLYFLGVRFGSFALPFALPGATAGAPWPTLPLLFAPAFAGLVGSLVELDNTGGSAKGKPPRAVGPAKLRVGQDEAEDAEIEEAPSSRERKA